MHQNEVGWATLTNNPCVGIPDHATAVPGRGGKCFPRLEAGVDETLHLPGQLVRTGRTATEVGTRCDQYAGAMRSANARYCRLLTFEDPVTTLGLGAARKRRGRWTRRFAYCDRG